MLKKTQHPWIQEKTGGERRLLAAGGRGQFALQGKQNKRNKEGGIRSVAVTHEKSVRFQFSQKNKTKKHFVWNSLSERQPRPRLASCRLIQMHTGRTQSHTHSQTNKQTRTHTLFLIWPIKTRVCEKRKKLSVVHTHALTHTQTHPAGPVPGKTLRRAQPKTTRDTQKSITMSDGYSTTWNSSYRISTTQHRSVLAVSSFC